MQLNTLWGCTSELLVSFSCLGGTEVLLLHLRFFVVSQNPSPFGVFCFLILIAVANAIRSSMLLPFALRWVMAISLMFVLEGLR